MEKRAATQISLNNVENIANKLKVIYDEAQVELFETNVLNNDKYVECLEISSNIIKFTDTLNPFVINRYKSVISSVYYISAEVLLRTVGLNMNRTVFTDQQKSVLYTCIAHLQKALNVEPFNIKCKELYKIIFMYLTMFNSDPTENINMLKNVLMVDPCDYQLQYNLGFMYQRANKLEESVCHLKLAIGIIDLHLNMCKNKGEKKDKIESEGNFKVLKQFKVKCLNSIGGVYFTIQDRELAKYFFYKALEILPNDPDIHNQLGVVFTELRNTDDAIMHYQKGILNYKEAHISTDLDMLLASMHMNMGLAFCYKINYPKAIECYNKALKYKPMLSLAYQNKLLDLNYISHLIEDPMYIAKLHKNINKIYPHVENDYKKSIPNYVVKKGINKNCKLNIGFISGDFICHPVSYFIHSILKNINTDLFNIHCFSLKVVSMNESFKKCNWHVVKGTSPEALKEIIIKQKIDILFDLASQTGDNRLDTFVLKPAPIQISYIGYPNTSGLSNMDYHIVDNYTDSDGTKVGPNGKVRPSTQKYYSEKLLFMPNCFLNYLPSTGVEPENLPHLNKVQPCIENGYLTIGTFNRYNKINDSVVCLWEKILERCPTVRFVIKTKEFVTISLREQFINTIKNKNLLSRIKILEYTDTYQEHLVDYNKMDISIDTFPYSGTTTSCESLLLGTPILTLFDNERQYHSQNVTTSLMINTGLEEFVVYSEDEYVDKIEYYSKNLEMLKDLKVHTRTKFLNSSICDYINFTKDFEKLMLNTYNNHNW